MGNRVDVNDRCTGCNACVSSCPVQVISLKTTGEGFWYPQINEHLCIECGRCLAICPVYGEKNTEGFFVPVSYAGWNKNRDEHMNSSSGGIFSILARSVLKQGGSVYGASYLENLTVGHIRIDKEDDLPKLRGSKYVQSFISKEIWNQVKVDLNSGKEVLFSGTPCQVAAANRIFSSYNNFLTVDVVCHGVPSPKAWRAYLDEIVAGKGEIASVNMRKKANGWKKIFFSTQFADNTVEECWFNDNLWGFSFVKNIFLRESCYNCEFKGHIRCSDISLGDFWEAARGCHREFDDEDRGTSIVLVNSLKGKKVIERVLREEHLFLKNIPYHWIPKNTYAVERSSSKNPKREQAFEMLDEYAFSIVVDKASGATVGRKVYLSVKNEVKKVVKKKKTSVMATAEKHTSYGDYKDGIGILNIQEVDNYGAVLLCYALQKTIEDLGYEAWVIDYRPVSAQNKDLIERVFSKLQKSGVKGIIDASLKKLLKKDDVNVNRSSSEKKNNFEKFREEYLHRTPVYSGMDTPDSPVFQTYVVGSDVVWKPDRVESSESDVYFLKFTDGLVCNRVAYAASIGTTDESLLTAISGKFSDYIQRFDHISLREATSVPYVQGMVDQKVFACADSTLLQNREIYDKIADKASNPVIQRYIYFYMFGDDPEAYEYVNKCSEQLKLPVVCQCNEPGRIDDVLLYCGDDGPAEFLNRIRNADYIVTDSFHGTVFAILYHKNFVTLSRGLISIRMQNLLERLGLQERYLDHAAATDIVKEMPDYMNIDGKIAIWRDESKMFLANALNLRGGGYNRRLVYAPLVIICPQKLGNDCTDCEVAA
ncbi:MAG: Coenzyme F420 hydrogenase/dehydrogenase, beta subunit C-terminal domain [Clostridia bacterium]|nr:Coenzyme F420 hydrogenase/dehydrogenase, beta subunit C-terminal domain [Clostridia bacterium]